MLLLEDLGSSLEAATSHAADLGEKIRSMLAPVYVLDGHPVVCTPSLGIVMLRGDLPLDAEELLKRADLALYKAKDEGRNVLRFFDPALQEEVNHRTALLRDLRAHGCHKFQGYLFGKPMPAEALPGPLLAE